MGIFSFKHSKHSRRRPDKLTNRQQGSRTFMHYYGAQNSRNREEVQSSNIRGIKDTGMRNSTSQRVVRLAKTRAHSLPTYVAIVVIIASLLYSSVLGSKPLVVVSADTGLFTKTYYEDYAARLASGSIMNRSKLTFDSRSFSSKLRDALPEVKEANVHIPLLGRRLVVGLSFVAPAYIFRVSGRDYIVGENGVVLAAASDVDKSKAAHLRLLEDKAPLQVSVGKTVLLASDVAFIRTVTNELAANGITVTSMVLPQGAGELYAYTSSYYIKFSFVGDAKQQVGACIAVLHTLGNTLPAEYIDARVGERVFVK